MWDLMKLAPSKVFWWGIK